MSTCAVISCPNCVKGKNKSQNTVLHCFPKNPKFAQKWAQNCGRPPSFKTAKARICSNHFSSSNYERDLFNELKGLPPRKKGFLREEAIPDLLLPKKIDVPFVNNKYVRLSELTGSQRPNLNKAKESVLKKPIETRVQRNSKKIIAKVKMQCLQYKKLLRALKRRETLLTLRVRQLRTEIIKLRKAKSQDKSGEAAGSELIKNIQSILRNGRRRASGVASGTALWNAQGVDVLYHS